MLVGLARFAGLGETLGLALVLHVAESLSAVDA
jgi:hypothetical protein